VKHTRASVIKRADTEYRALDKVIRQLEAADFRKPAMREEAPIRFTAKDVLAHINAWKWRQARVTSKDTSPEKPYEPPRLRSITDINAARSTRARIARRRRRSSPNTEPRTARC
jgi:hypothetical protein